MTDERVREVSLVNRLLTRPEFGAFLALVVVWLFFAIVAFDNNFVSWTTTAAILNRAAPLGILGGGGVAADDLRRVRPCRSDRSWDSPGWPSCC